jgi:hypothetical protein
MSYKRFFAMIATSTVVMFVLMYSTVFTLDHVWWSETKFWMAIYMGATMAVIMLSFMLSMYDDKRKNVAIFVGSALVFALALWLARSQTTVQDVGWMKAMIPHHSIAILTSERAEISDPRARRLADDIIRAQRAEIAEMEALIADLEGADYAEGEPIPPSVPPIEGGEQDVPGAPSLTLADEPLRGAVVLLNEVKVQSDAWVVVHPEAAGGGPDASTILGRSFLMHGTTERVPIELDAVTPSGTTLFVMLHDDTGEIGTFEFNGPGTPDQPLMANDAPVVDTFVVR